VENINENIVNEVKSRFSIESIYIENNVLRFNITRSDDLDARFKELVKVLKGMNYIAVLKNDEGNIRLDVAPYVWSQTNVWKRDIIITLVSLAFSLGTIFYTGMLLSNNELSTALFYTMSMILIIGLHEMGHFLTGRMMGVRISTPIFIPGLPQTGGTFGAVIRLREPIVDSKSLLFVGFSGPLVSFILSTIITYIGLSLSSVVPASQVPQGQTLPSSLILEILEGLVFGQLPKDSAILPHPIVFAGYIGLLITALNLTPIGQLDGGHVFRSFLSERMFRMISFIFILLLIVLRYWGMAVIGLFIMENPGALNDVSKPRGIGLLLPVFSIIIWILSIAIMI
jgi:Zn-dependent protease